MAVMVAMVAADSVAMVAQKAVEVRVAVRG